MTHLKCKNCKYYVQHYAIYQDCGIWEVDCGHCVKNKRHKLIKNCENFEEGNNQMCYAIYNIAQIMYNAHKTCEDLCDQIAEIRKEMAEQINKNFK